MSAPIISTDPLPQPVLDLSDEALILIAGLTAEGFHGRDDSETAQMLLLEKLREKLSE